ncbi:MAG TPA: chain length determinant protein EpsF [Burkholderiaceae bacterium]
MSFLQILSILLARRRVIFWVFLIVVATATTLSFILPKSYTAETTVVVDVKNPDPVVGAMLQPTALPGYMATQVDILTSDRVARTVVQMLGFDKEPTLIARWREDTDGKGTDFVGYMADKLQRKLDVKPSKESNVISIQFTAGDPKTAAAVANTFAKAYLQTNVDLMVEPAKRYTDWFADRTKKVREKLEQQNAQLSQMQKDKGVVQLDDRLDSETARLNDLMAQLTIQQAQRSEAQSREHVATLNPDTAPDVLNNPVVQSLRTTITAAEGKLREASNTLGQNHPQIKEQRAEIEELKAKLRTEISAVASSLNANAMVNSQKEGELRAAVEAQKKRVLDLKKQRDEMNVLAKDVEVTQNDYNNINQRLSQTTLESQTHQTDVAVLTPAYEPEEPSKPKILLNIVASIFLGGMLGMAVALLMELLDRRVRSEHDLADMGIPVLGGLATERFPKKRRLFGRREPALQAAY